MSKPSLGAAGRKVQETLRSEQDTLKQVMLSEARRNMAQRHAEETSKAAPSFSLQSVRAAADSKEATEVAVKSAAASAEKTTLRRVLLDVDYDQATPTQLREQTDGVFRPPGPVNTRPPPAPPPESDSSLASTPLGDEGLGVIEFGFHDFHEAMSAPESPQSSKSDGLLRAVTNTITAVKRLTGDLTGLSPRSGDGATAYEEEERFVEASTGRSLKTAAQAIVASGRMGETYADAQTGRSLKTAAQGVMASGRMGETYADAQTGRSLKAAAQGVVASGRMGETPQYADARSALERHTMKAAGQAVVAGQRLGVGAQADFQDARGGRTFKSAAQTAVAAAHLQQSARQEFYEAEPGLPPRDPRRKVVHSMDGEHSKTVWMEAEDDVPHSRIPESPRLVDMDRRDALLSKSPPKAIHTIKSEAEVQDEQAGGSGPQVMVIGMVFVILFARVLYLKIKWWDTYLDDYNYNPKLYY